MDTFQTVNMWTRSGLLFGKMWEDSDVEYKLLQQVLARKGKCRALCIASSGDTAFHLASAGQAEITAFDINPSQLSLCRLKQAILSQGGGKALADLLYSDARPALGVYRLPEECGIFWQRHEALLKSGFHRAGRVDKMMAFWVWLFSKLVVSRSRIDQLLSCADLDQQKALVDGQWRGWKWDLGLKVAFWPPILRAIYGSELVSGLPPDFGEQIGQRMVRFLTEFEADKNPYLWQTFGPPRLGRSLPPYLKSWGMVNFQAGTIEQVAEGPYDLFTLSNILEVASPSQIQELLESVLKSAAPGALVCLRFMAPRPRVWKDQEYLEEESSEATRSDRAFFCNGIQLYRMPSA